MLKTHAVTTWTTSHSNQRRRPSSLLMWNNTKLSIHETRQMFWKRQHSTVNIIWRVHFLDSKCAKITTYAHMKLRLCISFKAQETDL